jgi:DNA polymerase-4
MRKIIHIDADCFYAAIEMRDNPALGDRPLAVGGSAARRGVIATCNYAARRFGVRSAMASAYAQRLCPDLLIIPPNMPKYREASARMHDVFRLYTDIIEPLSLDEAYLDVTDCDAFGGSATRIAEAIRHEIKERVGISVSAGVSVNKFVAKVASEWRKPDGLYVVGPDEVDAFVAALPVTRIPGVGHVTGERLARMGLRTCADLRALDSNILWQRLGSFGSVLAQRAWGQDDRPVQVSRVRKSVSVERTFAEDVAHGPPCHAQLPVLMTQLLERLHTAGAQDRIEKAFVKVKFADFSSTTVERVGTTARASHFAQLLDEALTRNTLPIRLLGLGVRLTPQEADGTGEQLLLPVDVSDLNPG